jgi:molybdopterin-guanine dinucleotide biosynthesis protein A
VTSVSPTHGPLQLAAVILAGGSGVRLGGVDKASIEIDGVTLLEHALASTIAARDVVVVGTEVPTTRPVTWTREDPAGGGPAAGLFAGLDMLMRPPDLVAVLAVDMPRVHAATIARLTWSVENDPAADGALLLDGTGRRQPLAAVYRHAALTSVRPADPAAEHGLSLRMTLEGLRLVEVPTIGDEGHDVDTWEDLRRLRGRED